MRTATVNRVVGLTVLLVGVELLERIAYRAGVTDAGAAADSTLAGLADPRDSDDDLADVDEDLQAFDASDVLAFHGYVTA